jgi:hypothetical protein
MRFQVTVTQQSLSNSCTKFEFKLDIGLHFTDVSAGSVRIKKNTVVPLLYEEFFRWIANEVQSLLGNTAV